MANAVGVASAVGGLPNAQAGIEQSQNVTTLVTNSLNLQAVNRSLPNLSVSNVSNNPEKADDCVNTALPYKVARKAGRILQHFAIRTPHILFAMSSVYLITKYYFGQQEFAVEATTFVGTASAMYCFLKPFFLEVIPYSLLPTTQKLWRESINLSNTIFITLTLSTAVWGLKIQAIVGTAIWAASFGVPFALLSSRYPPIDAHYKNKP